MMPLAKQNSAMVSDSDLVDRLRQLLRTSDLRSTTATILRRTLEEEYGVDLSERKGFIRRRIELFLEGRDDEMTTENDGVDDNIAEEVIEGEGVESVVTDDDDKIGCEEEDGGEGEEVEEEERGGKRRRRRKGRSDKVANAVKKRPAGFMIPCGLSPQLQTIVGESELARPEVVRRMWAYIREKNLQDPKHKRKILCDKALFAIFCVKSIDMFEMSKALSKHIGPLNYEDVSGKSSQKKKQRKHGREVSNEQQVKKQKGKSSGFLAPVPLSDALVKFFGTGENELSRSDVVKRIWDYIKQKDLQDSSDKRIIICDEKLKELFEVDSFTGFLVSKLLEAHFVKGREQ